MSNKNVNLRKKQQTHELLIYYYYSSKIRTNYLL